MCSLVHYLPFALCCGESHRHEFQRSFVFLFCFVTRPNDVEAHLSFQSDDGERGVVYNTVGPNVCMGDHKVTVEMAL